MTTRIHKMLQCKGSLFEMCNMQDLRLQCQNISDILLLDLYAKNGFFDK